MKKYLLLLVTFNSILLKSSSQEINDYLGKWEGVLTMYWGEANKKLYKLHINFLTVTGKNIKGSIAVYDGDKLTGENNSFVVTYNSKDHSISYNSLAITPDGSSCQGNYIYHFSNNSKSLIGEFVPKNKACAKVEVALNSSQQNQESIIKIESKDQYANTNNGWYTSLPPCPCTYEEAKQKGNTPGPEGEWQTHNLESVIKEVVLDKYHFGAWFEARWVPKDKTKPGQQCTYAKDGKLITSGLAAGTPDRSSPIWSGAIKDQLLGFEKSDHYKNDIKPWNEISCAEYLKNWPPNVGISCTANPVNPFDQLLKFVDSMTCTQISEIFQIIREDELIRNSIASQFFKTGVASDAENARQLSRIFKELGKKGFISGPYAKTHIKNFYLKCTTYFDSFETSNKNFTIKPEWVTLPTDKEFKWYDWEKAPEDLKIAAKYIHTYKNNQTSKDEILIDDIHLNLQQKCRIKIAAVDLNEDGVCGLAIFSEGSFCCGTAGCSFDLFENGGLSVVDLGTDYEVKPAKNGVTASTGRFFSIKRNVRITVDEKEIIRLFTYDKSKANNKKPELIIDTKKLVGGSTPDELGKILLKALQTNNKALWTNCIHPATEKEKRQKIIDNFDRFRRTLQEKGVSQWDQIQLSRVTYENRDYCSDCAPPGEKLIVDFGVEFWYKQKEFLGIFEITRVVTHKGKYLMDGCLDCFAALKRNSNK